jgi:hypothetical protein
MNLQPVQLREGQTIQCTHCLQMKGAPIVADLDGPAFKAYYCVECATEKYILDKVGL